MLEIRNLTVKGKNGALILNGVSLELSPGECIGLTGESGSGKTTLLKAVLGMSSEELFVCGGEILLDGTDLLKKTARERRLLCGKIFGFVPQNPMTAFFPHARIGRQMTETLRLHTGMGRREAAFKAAAALRQVNLEDTERIMNSCPGQLSGGMLQRIAVALILGTGSEYILADEPSSALDEENRDQLLSLLDSCREHSGILLLTHDAAAMKSLCSVTYVMEQGRIIEAQPTGQIFLCPQQLWTKRFAEAAGRREEVKWHWTVLN